MSKWVQHPQPGASASVEKTKVPVLSMVLFPNPTNGNFTVSYAVRHTSDVSLTVTDLAGRQIIRINNPNKMGGGYNEKIDLENLNPGMYICTLKVGDQFVSKKFCKLQ